MRRRQLSLFVAGPAVDAVERVRRLVDPVQSALIPAHVTLCREDEIDALASEKIASRVAGSQPLHLSFGRPEAFSGHGILLPCIEGEQAFTRLRHRVLGTADIRESRAHITLAHPRNPKAQGNSLDDASLDGPLILSFERVMLIEQAFADAPWTILEEFPFHGCGGRA